MSKYFFWGIGIIWAILLIIWFEEQWTVREYLTNSIVLTSLATGFYFMGWLQGKDK